MFLGDIVERFYASVGVLFGLANKSNANYIDVQVKDYMK